MESEKPTQGSQKMERYIEDLVRNQPFQTLLEKLRKRGELLRTTMTKSLKNFETAKQNLVSNWRNTPKVIPITKLLFDPDPIYLTPGRD